MIIKKALFLLPISLLFCAISAARVRADDLEVGSAAPLFSAANQDGAEFSLAARKGQGWTVLYFYPKAGTPGCTKQACAFRDAIKKIQDLDAEVFGISTDTVEALAKFHKEHQLKFDLLADPEGAIVLQYGAKMLAVNYANRWTFILDPELKIRAVEKDVDPAMDAERVAAILTDLQGKESEAGPKKE